MMRKTILTLLAACNLLVIMPVHGQPEEAPPYLYYYSSLLGGLIIERADGTDSRHIGADIIPPDMTGLGGPGWSPSGNYFAARQSPQEAIFLIDMQGDNVIDWIDRIKPVEMQWSPSGEDWLFIIGTTTRYTGGRQSITFLLVDVERETVLVEYVENFAMWPYERSDTIWQPEQEQIRFYIAPEIYSDDQFFQITMQFDGTVLKEPVTEKEYQTHYSPPLLQYDDSHLYDAYGVSPSGRYEADGKYPTVLRDLSTNTLVELPTHSQGTICRGYQWSIDENYIITLDGVLRAGGGCGWAVIGVTDRDGDLWRELGNCGWGPPCIGWLPPQVDIAMLPPGQPEPVLLEPAKYEPAVTTLGWDDAQTVLLRCEVDWFNIVDRQMPDELLFQLQQDEPCPYRPNDSVADIGLEILIAYDPDNKLLATYLGQEHPISMWSMRDITGIRILRLNTYGYELEFIDDGEYLRARNVNAWKVYSVADILDYANRR